MPGERAAVVYRGDAIEAIHHASIAVVNSDGVLTHYLGDPDEAWVTRSSVKPFQVLPLIMTGGLDKFGFSRRQLALMCASHTGTDEHRELAAANLDLAGNTPELLQCGTHRPMFMQLDGIYPLQREDKDPLRHNCSGKHSGFLALARHMGEPVEEYLDPNKPVQQAIKQSVADMCRYPAEKIKVGIDGCSAPVFSLPLTNMAVGFMRLATLQGDNEEHADALDRVRQAMFDHPFLISGDKRLDYDLMRSFPNNIVCKIGAEAIEGIGLAEQEIGICVKIIDGGERALGVVCVEVLKQLGLIDSIDNFPHLQRHEHPEIRNYREIPAGQILPDFELKKVV